ncbi:hypothetical protein ACQEUU_04595 [Nonomuraea sp. CA-218870]|uniref:hypothetical protein n=1 Tax=Nonomuraea sp. CA-218870 TaxID=3239998 RepID=UPI003D8C4C89
MIFLGLLLVILGVGGAILVFAEEGTTYDVFGYVFQPNHVEMFVAGAAAATVLLLGLWLIALGSRRSARRRRALRGVRADASQRVAELENEKRRLQERLEKEQAAKEQAAKDAAKEQAATDRVARHAADDRTTTTTAPAVTADDRLVARGTEESRR